MALLATPDGSLWIGAGYPGRVHQIRPGFVQEGLFISSVKDADLVSRFGQIGWRAAAPDGTGLRLSNRSGNVSLPDETWSDWSADYAEPSGQPVVSPAARFLQYRIKMTSRPGGATPSLQEVSITYSPRNLPPQITQLEFVGAAPAPAGAPSKKPSPGSPATLGSPAPSVTGLPELGAALAGAVSLKWSASDPNGDKLAATGFFRTKGSTPWKPLIPRNAATSLDWDTARLPDGWYEFRLVVDDQDSATRENGLSAEVITPPLLLDNAGPVFKDVRTDPDGKGQLTVSGVVEDALSYIAVASYSLDGQPWESLRPKDEILDGLREEVFGVLKDVSPGPHEFCLMAKDRAGNVAYHRIRIDAPAATSP
jgi:hypothetical protein